MPILQNPNQVTVRVTNYPRPLRTAQKSEGPNKNTSSASMCQKKPKRKKNQSNTSKQEVPKVWKPYTYKMFMTIFEFVGQFFLQNNVFKLKEDFSEHGIRVLKTDL
jgi:hypothetical protein